MGPTMYTIGHSTRTLPQLVGVLQEHGVKLLVDVRSIPKSGTNPQFNKERLAEQLPGQGLQYVWLGKELGGLRKRVKASELNAGWDNASFRGYADYMQCQDFQDGLQQLLAAAEAQGPAVYMCAEMMYFSCHRSLISDALLVRGWQVQHITAAGRPTTPHKLTKFAKVEGLAISYPAYAHEPRAPKRRAHARAMVTAAGPAGTTAAAAAAAAAAPLDEGSGALDTEASRLKAAASKGNKGRTTARSRSRAVKSAAAAPRSAGTKRHLGVAACAAEPQQGKQQRVDAMLTRARAKQQLH